MLFFGLLSLAVAREVTFVGDNRPVAKVIALLKDMQHQLETEKKEDEDLYDKLSCWCTKNRGEKTEATRIAEARIAALESDVKQMTAKASGLKQEMADVAAEIADNKQALAKATAIREKDTASFNAEEKEMISSIQSLRNALTVLEKHQSFLQQDQSNTLTLASVSASLKHVVSSNEDLINQILNPSDHAKLNEFVQGHASSPQGGEIFGVLGQMKENFEKNLDASRAGESKALEDFASVKAAKTEEIAAGQEQYAEKRAAMAKTVQLLAQAKEDLEDTSNSLSADQEFLIDLEKRCAITDAEWEARSQTRQEEIAAVSEAVSILSEDDAHDLFSSSLGFLQVSAVRRKTTLAERQRAQAQKVITKAAGIRHNVALATLASSVKLDSFEKVKAAIDEMVKSLQEEMADEVTHKDFCNGELHENDLETMAKKNEHEDLVAKVDALKSAIAMSDKELHDLRSDISTMQVEQQRANENRQAQNKEFQQTVADQRATQQILNKALDRLRKFYNNALLQVKNSQEPGAAAPPPPQGFADYKRNAGAGGVITMLQAVITDAKNMEKEAIKDEQDAQQAYEGFVADTNRSVEEAQRAIVNKTEVKAKAESDLVQANADKASTEANIESLSAASSALHSSCDYVTKNFDVRQQARGQEIESLKQAKGILSGA